MLTINTNLSSLIAQSSMKASTNKLNQAIERMTTGFKINHAKDNAANYAISTNMTTKINSLMVAEDNASMGLDLVNTASDVISMMQDKASRLSALSIQAQNGTYGGKSLEAINSEAMSIMSEIQRLYMTSEYNGISLFNRANEVVAAQVAAVSAEDSNAGIMLADAGVDYPIAKAEYNNFIGNPKNYTDEQVAAMTTITEAIAAGSLTSGGRYSISSKEELVKLANYVNGGNDTNGMKFVLGADIDLSSISNWTPIGDYSTDASYQFKGTFDGNGHVIKNLKIDRGDKDYQGLFGYVKNGYIYGVALTNIDITGANYTGGLVGFMYSADVRNCYATGEVSGKMYVGGLVGQGIDIKYCYTNVSVTGESSAAGLVGKAYQSNTINEGSAVDYCYATGNVNGNAYIGGLVASLSTGDLTNSYATGNVTGDSTLGGLAASSSHVIKDCYATGEVSGNKKIGGLVGYTTSAINDSYATGEVSGNEIIGGLVGYASDSDIINSYAEGDVLGITTRIGGLVGSYNLNKYSNKSVTNCHANGNVTGKEQIGGLIGLVQVHNEANLTATNNYASGNVIGETFVGGLIGKYQHFRSTDNITQNITTSKVNGADADSTGSFIGGFACTDNGTNFGSLNFTDCEARDQGLDTIGGCYKYASSRHTLLNNAVFDKDALATQISQIQVQDPAPVPDAGETDHGATTLQVGVNGDSSCQITFDLGFTFDLSAVGLGIETQDAYNAITVFLNTLSEKSTMLGAVQNRLESVLDEITIKRDNLISSRSTIRDADIAETSSTYIQQQILQQASATLLATANQTPSIALQLI